MLMLHAKPRVVREWEARESFASRLGEVLGQAERITLRLLQ